MCYLLRRSPLLCCLFVLFCTSETRSQDSAPKFAPAEIEWFEREVRPLLSEHCSSCHSTQVGTSKGGFSLDSRETILTGGDSGPAIVPGKPDESLLVEAIRRESFEMPPEKPLSQRDQQVLVRWVEMGAPWPSQKANSTTGQNWLDDRKQQHWAWRPLQAPAVPQTEGDHWSESSIDRFIYAQLHAEEIEPASSCDATSLARRLNFDLTGLPPTTARIQPDLSSEQSIASHVDQLLSSPQFGVRWGRHWMDLVRFAETLGHEFDYPVRHAWQYRDAIIDSFNTDVPYERIMREHIAGDQLQAPRRHPTSGVNQSLAMTSFWWFGDSVHAPVDIRQDWASRVDNQIEVFSKTFLGMTVACARCHDHKFDAISQADYYSLAGMLESTRREYTPTDPKGLIAAHREKIQQMTTTADELAAKMSFDEVFSQSTLVQLLSDYVERVEGLEPKERKSEQVTSNPLFVLLAAAKNDDFTREIAKLKESVNAESEAYQAWLSQTELMGDFTSGLPNGWQVSTAGDLNEFTSLDKPRYDWFTASLPLPNFSGFSSRYLGREQQLILRSPTFDLTKPVICIKSRGKDCQSSVMPCNFFMSEFHTLLFKDTRKNINQTENSSWLVHRGDINKYIGEPTFISIDDLGKGWFDVQEVRLADQPPPVEPSQIVLDVLAQDPQSPDALYSAYAEMLLQAFSNAGVEGHTASKQLLQKLFAVSDRLELSLPDGLKPLEVAVADLQTIDSESPKPVYLLAAAEGSARNAELAVRGNPHQRAEAVARARLTAVNAGMHIDDDSSGRLELAAELSRPDNPLTSRVIVNRVWHHLLGRGLVSSTDNLGVLGGRPTHPELLDYLATQLVEHNWSLKWLIREIVTSKTYRLSSAPAEQHELLDADGALLSHRSVRRLSAEALRDSLLLTSKSIDLAIAGPSIPIHLNDQMTGRGRPKKGGPLDGQGRRSTFVEVRRNFLDPFLLAFDFPMPATSAGDRNVSNVPAQALGLLNDPLVLELTQRWTARTEELTDSEARVRDMISTAFSRVPSEQEVEHCLRFVTENGEGSWTALAHVLINSKEFSYLR